MAYELVEEVFQHAPPMTAAERLILVAIAELCRVGDRMRYIDGAEMMRRCCVEARGLAHALVRLAERGLDVRVPIGRDKRGQPVYAIPGLSRLFKLPHLKPAPGDCRCRMCRQADLQVTLPLEGLGRPDEKPADTGTSEADPAVILLEKDDVEVWQADLQVRVGGPTSQPAGPTGHPYPSVENPSGSADDPLADTAAVDDSSAATAGPGDATGAWARAQLRERMGWKPPAPPG
jgi:hypothetical protein